MVTFIGPHNQFTTAGFLFRRGEPRPVPPEVAAALAGHPWFDISDDDFKAQEPVKPRRGRPRKS